MARMLCLAIGVGNAPPLDYLRGAVNGARAMADWARAAGYETACLTDEKAPVELADVKAALDGLLAGQPADRLVIHFAGHGVSQGAGEELWLLSRWEQELQAVSVSGLRRRLEAFRVRQLAIISDACRTNANDWNTATLDRLSVLGNSRENRQVPQTEMLFASSDFRVAYMIGRREAARCIFTAVLVEALSGVDDDAFEDADRTRGISSDSLADYLKSRVPKVAADYAVELTPVPLPGFRRPDDKWVPPNPSPPPAPPRPPWPAPDAGAVAGMGGGAGTRIQPGPGESWTTIDEEFGLESLGATEPPAAEIAAADAAAVASQTVRADAIEQAVMEAFHNEYRPTHAETGFIMNVGGDDMVEGRAGPFTLLRPDGPPGWWIMDAHWGEVQASPVPVPWWEGGIPLKAPLPLLLRMASGQWVGTAALPHFVLSVGVDVAGAQSVIFRSMDSPMAPGAERAMALLRGRGLDRGAAADLAGELRAFKHTDPMLGVIAAYLHDAEGDLANVHRTAAYFAHHGQPIPFDIALLGRLAATRAADGLVRVEIPEVAEEPARGRPWYLHGGMAATSGILAGAFPWMRQGWWLLMSEGEGDLYPPGLAKLARHLMPAPFTTLDAAGGEALAALIFGKDG